MYNINVTKNDRIQLIEELNDQSEWEDRGPPSVPGKSVVRVKETP